MSFIKMEKMNAVKIIIIISVNINKFYYIRAKWVPDTQ